MSQSAEFNALPARLSLGAYRGTTFGYVLTYAAGDPPVAVNLTGWRGELRLAGGSTFTTEDDPDVLQLGGINGTVTIAMTPVQTNAQPRGSQYYTLVLTAPGGEEYALLDGLFAFNGG